jgi:ADP-heptose:LPS heptosyltransferase
MDDMKRHIAMPRHPAEKPVSAAEWARVKRVLAVRLDNIGDVVMLGPALRELQRLTHGAQLTLLASPAGAQAAPLLPEVDRVLMHRAFWQATSGEAPSDPARERGLAEQLRAEAYDAAVIFTSFSQSPYPAAFVCHEAGIPMRVGQSKEFGGQVLTHWVMPGPDHAHQAERSLALVSAGDEADSRLRVRVPESAREWAVRALGPELRDFALVAPGASCPARRYSRFAEVVAELGSLGVETVVVGGERERATCDAVAAASPFARSLAGESSIPQLAALVERAGVVVANDSLTLHLAEALLRPLVALYSGVNERSQFGPRFTRSVMLGAQLPCSPCHAFACPHGTPCLDVAPSEVARAAAGLLERELVAP